MVGSILRERKTPDLLLKKSRPRSSSLSGTAGADDASGATRRRGRKTKRAVVCGSEQPRTLGYYGA
jgi:hypothetical protein